MAKRLPKEVTKFLLENPDELKRVQFRMKDVERERTRPEREAAEAAQRAALPLKKCSALPYTNCQNMTPGGYLCDACAAEFRDDPDAFK